MSLAPIIVACMRPMGQLTLAFCKKLFDPVRVCRQHKYSPGNFVDGGELCFQESPQQSAEESSKAAGTCMLLQTLTHVDGR